ncbi:hypothetical protein [Actinomadura flavalba]|uniref:DUF7873 family protein n=1 Tax=Actinomadura flavalba TaxID=1120938 RepID=UPI00036D2362|nr:hypothetical protein [Actinomadura flavalba]
MSKLNQIIAVEKGVRGKAQHALAEARRTTGTAALLSGISRSYQPKDEDGDEYPPESTKVQITAEQALRDTAAAVTRLFDVTATKDHANCEARADVVVEGRTLLTGVPVTHLLFLEKQIAELQALVARLPVLDAAESWTFDAATDVWRTDPVRTVKTKKVPFNHVKAEATDKHPAQVEVFYEDVAVGHWTTVKFSGALPARRVNELLERLDALSRAVKFAREEANGFEVTDREIGEVIFGYLLG